MAQQAELYELRLHRLEQLNSSIVESQASMVQILQEHARRLDRIEKRLTNVEGRLENVEGRLENVEKLLELALNDLAFIREILKPGE